jgi:hypothetical protein
VTLKGQYIEKIELDIIYLPRKNNLQILFFRNLGKKTLLSAYLENMLNGEKVLKVRISRLIVEQHEKKF